MSHTFQPCSSSEPRDCRQLRPVFGEQHRVLPCLAGLLLDSPETLPGLFRRAKCEMLLSPLLHLLDDLFEVFAHCRYRLARDLHFSDKTFSDHNIERAVLIIFSWIVIAEMRATAFFS